MALWKRIGTLLVVLIVVAGATVYYLSDKLYLRFAHAAVSPAQFTSLYAPARLTADFNFMTAQIEHIHPDIAAVTDAAAYTARKRAILAGLTHPMTRVQFYALTSAINSCYLDGHTEVQLPAEELAAWQAAGRYPPLSVEVQPDSIVVAHAIGEPQIPAGAQLLSLNGVGAATLANWMLERTSGESLAGRAAYAGARFPRLVWVYGLRPPYTIVYQRAGAQPVSVSSPGVTAAAWNAATGAGSGVPATLSIADGVAIIELRDFAQPEGVYSAFLAATFRRLRAAQVRSLIIDLRGNSGGDSREADELQAYLSDDYLPGLARVTVRTTPEVKAVYRTLLPPGFRWIPLNALVPMLRGIDTAPDGGTYVFDPDPPRPQRRSHPRDEAFHGDLFLLVSPYTYSTAVLFAAPLKYWHRAVIVGEAPAEPLTFFGDDYRFDAPATKLVTDVSHKSFELLGSGGPRSRLEPDLALSSQAPDAMALALAEIKRRATRGSP